MQVVCHDSQLRQRCVGFVSVVLVVVLHLFLIVTGFAHTFSLIFFWVRCIVLVIF